MRCDVRIQGDPREDLAIDPFEQDTFDSLILFPNRPLPREGMNSEPSDRSFFQTARNIDPTVAERCDPTVEALLNEGAVRATLDVERIVESPFSYTLAWRRVYLWIVKFVLEMISTVLRVIE